MLKFISIALVVSAVLLFSTAMNMDIAVKQEGFKEPIANFGLMFRQLEFIIISGFLFLSGIILGIKAFDSPCDESSPEEEDSEKN